MGTREQLNKISSPLRYYSGNYVRGWQHRASHNPFTIVLCYHRVVPGNSLSKNAFAIENGISASDFEAQMRFMQKHFQPIKTSQVLDPTGQPMQFAVTLDDGYEDNYSIAAPILQRLGIPATFYVVSDFVGSNRLFWWEQLANIVRQTKERVFKLRETLPDLPVTVGQPDLLPLANWQQKIKAYEFLSASLRAGSHDRLAQRISAIGLSLNVVPNQEGRKYAMMDWQQVQELTQRGFEIGGHTATHCNVANTETAHLENEIRRSTRAIENNTGLPVATFAYPYGHYDKEENRAADILENCGCKIAFTTAKGVVRGQQNPLELPRAKLNRRFDFACAYNVQDTLFAAP